MYMLESVKIFQTPPVKNAAFCVIGWFTPPPTLGLADSATFVNAPDHYSIMIRYTSKDNILGTVTSEVTFECRRNFEGIFTLTSANATGSNYYEFKLETKYVIFVIKSTRQYT